MGDGVKRTPELRLSGFEGEWVERPLSELSYRSGKKNTDLAIRETFTNSAQLGVISQLEYFDNNISNVSSLGGYYIVEEDDFIYNPRVSTAAPVGPLNRNELARRGVVSPLYLVFTINGLDLDFAKWFFKSRSWHNHLRTNGDSGARGDRFSITNGDFFRMPVVHPKVDEQEQIGTFFHNLDTSINAAEARHEALKHLRQTMLVKMFPQGDAREPEIRFNGFEGEWETGFVADVADQVVGFPFESSGFKTKGITLVRGGNVKRGFLDRSPEITVYWDTTSGLETFLLEEGDIVIQMDGALIGRSFAKIQSTDLPALLVQRVSRLRVSGYDVDFLFAQLKAGFLAYIRKNKTETAIPHLSSKDIDAFPVWIPSLEEQRAIGTYFRNLDELIEAESTKVEKLRNLKSALLEKMFV